MSYLMSTFVLSVQRKFNDYSTYMSDLVYESTRRRVYQFEDMYKSPSMVVSQSFQNTAASADKNLSTYSGITANSIIKMILDDTGAPLQRLSLARYLETESSASSNSEATASNWVPITEDTIKLCPIPSQSKVYTFYANKKHVYLSTAAMYFQFPDDEVEIIKNGVIADMYEEKDDTRNMIYERRYRDGIKDKQRKLRMAEGQNTRLLPGDSRE